MSRSFRLVEYLTGPHARLYTVYFLGKELDELDEFIEREDGAYCNTGEQEQCKWSGCKRRCKRPEYLSKIAENLDLAVKERGFDSYFFSQSDNYPYPLGAFKFGTYRLFGLRYGKDLFVAGNGGVKLVQAIQEDAVLQGYLDDMKTVGEALQECLNAFYEGKPPLDTAGRRYLPSDLGTFEIE